MYKRVLLKISGEMFSGSDNSSFDFEQYNEVAKYLVDFAKTNKVELAIVVGGGNIWRYRDTKGSELDRVSADKLGMVATTFNAKLLENAIQKAGKKAVSYSALKITGLMPKYDCEKARESLKDSVVILAGGTGNPYFTTDSAAVLRAIELKCDLLMKATKVDGVYESDPVKNPKAKKFPQISYDEVLARSLEVMDLTAIAQAKENKLPMLVFDFSNPANLQKVMKDFSLGTLVN